jgi:hypothetical protein
VNECDKVDEMRVAVVTGLIGFWVVAGCSSPMATSRDSSVPGADGPAGSGDGSGGGAGAASAGTGGGDALPPIDANPSTAQGFCLAYLELVAEYFSRCDDIPLDYARRLFVGDSPCKRFQGNIAAGRLAFDGTHGASCLQALGTALAVCGESTSMQDTGGCEQVMTPLVPVGGACTSFYNVSIGEQCKDGAYCKKGASYACTGVCTTRNPIGGACSLDTDVRCVTGATCDSTSKMCVASPPSPGAGEACGAAGQPSCVRGLYCDRTGADAGAALGVCRAKKTSGACASDIECATPIRCVGKTAMTCTATKKEGEACTPNAHECDVASHCGADGKCTSAPAAVGEPCATINNESIGCAAGAYCDVSLLSNQSGTCRAEKQDGDACTGPPLQECGGDNGHCDTATHKCLSCAP